jgi:type II secretory pathway component GspD/PulD (secretin)
MKKPTARLVLMLLAAAAIWPRITSSALADDPPAAPPPGLPPGDEPVAVAAPAAPVSAATNAATTSPTNAVAVAPQTSATPAAAPEVALNQPLTPPETAGDGSGTDELHLNFRGAPIEMVLNYLSDAAGFIIQLNAPLSGKMDVWSAKALNKDEAVALLNAVLNRNGFAAVRNGRLLTIMTKADALHADIPVVVGSDPAAIPSSDEMITQIIPLRYLEAGQLVKDISPLLSPQSTIVANSAGNSVVMTDTRSNIRHIVEIIHAIDSSAEDVTELRVFPLKFHDPVEVAELLTDLFSEQGSSSGSQSPIRFGDRGGFREFFGRFGGEGGPPGSRGGDSGNPDRAKKRSKVTAVADARTSSVVVMAAKELMSQIASMVEQIDHESTKVAHVSVIHLDNADPQQVQQVLQDMFQTGTGARGNSSQKSALMNRAQQQQQQNQNNINSSFGSSGLGSSRSTMGTQF